MYIHLLEVPAAWTADLLPVLLYALAGYQVAHSRPNVYCLASHCQRYVYTGVSKQSSGYTSAHRYIIDYLLELIYALNNEV